MTALAPGRFAHLEVHSHFSLLGSTASLANLVARAAAEGMPALALTDTNALYGAMAFARECERVDVRPIIGMAANVAAPPGLPTLPGSPSARLIFLATGPTGYRSLCGLSSRLQGSAEREQRTAQGLKWDELQAHRPGLICLSGGRMGWIERYLRANDLASAQAYAGRLAGLYGENAYLAIELHTPADQRVAQEVSTLGRRLGLEVAAIQPVYCLEPQETARLRLLAAIDHNCRLEDVLADALPAHGDPAVSVHWLSTGEVVQRFAGMERALEVAAKVAERCGPALRSGRPVWPDLQLPPGQTPTDALAAAAQSGLRMRYGDAVPAAVQARLEHELAAIAEPGYEPLFLVVSDIVRFARQAAVPVSTRGSVANSLVAYCTGITTVDPIEHDLLFERFLNPARQDVPDIDLDFCSRRRDEVLEYVRDKYGPEHVALVGTVSTMQPRSAVWETGKAYGLEDEQIKRLVGMLPRGWHPDPRRRDKRGVDDVVAQLKEPRLREAVRAAYSIVDLPHHLSVHPGAVVITPGRLTDIVPVQWAPKGFLITQFDHSDVERLGLPKIDLLGISALTVLADAAELVASRHVPNFRLADIPLDDPLTGDMLARGETVGVFQCESEGAQRTLRKLRARTIRDLAVANAFFKPGPSTGGMARHFVSRYRNEEAVAFLHPALEPILKPTQGVLLFQEQILRIAREIAGMSWAEADHLRRGASKFGAAEMDSMRERFLAGCMRPPPGGPGFSAPNADQLWQQVVAFAGYGFNQGHATAYADVTYRTAYLKAHWPAAYLAARLGVWGGFHHPAVYAAEAIRLGIAVRPPHINHSGSAFTLAWDQSAPILWMGLGQVRDLRRATAEAIGAERQHGAYSDLRDLLARVSLQSKELAHLIKCGALDDLAVSRAALLAESGSIKQAGSALQMAFDFADHAVPREDAAQRLAWETEILGWPVSVHPLDTVRALIGQAAGLPAQDAARPKHPVTVAGARLPGWTGADGFFLSDGRTYAIVKTGKEEKAPPVWQPLLVHGRWKGDGWGTWWLQADTLTLLGPEGVTSGGRAVLNK